MGAPSNAPPNRPWFARNAAIFLALKSFVPATSSSVRGYPSLRVTRNLRANFRRALPAGPGLIPASSGPRGGRTRQGRPKLGPLRLRRRPRHAAPRAHRVRHPDPGSTGLSTRLLQPGPSPWTRARSRVLARRPGAMSVVNALPSPRRADPELGEVCPSATDVPLVAEVPPYLRQALVTSVALGHTSPSS